MLARERLIDTARRVYRSYGFSPIDTPALEYTEILLGKGGGETDKQMFRFLQGKRDVAMRFDLTVPFARFAAQHINELGTPFKRYHIGTVWRAERPQKGRYREFLQCDFDTIGTQSSAADIETLLVIHDLFDAIGREFQIPDFGFRIGLLESLDLADRAAGILRALDKLAKIGREKVITEMTETGDVSAAQAGHILDVTHQTSSPDGLAPSEILQNLRSSIGGHATADQGIAQLEQLFAVSAQAGIPSERIVLDIAIARGLDYYTGTIYETFLTALPGIGSVCSGGRYDHLAALYTSQELPGIGASLGLDRLLAALEELGCLADVHSPAAVLITQFDATALGTYLAVVRALHAAGIAAEIFPEARPLGKQLKYAARKGFRLAVIAGTDELQSGRWQVKDLSRGEQQSVAVADLPSVIAGLLADNG